MTDSGVRVTLDARGAFAKAIRDLGRTRVMVGVPATTAERQPEPGENEPLNNAAIGYILENGAPEANIPARPFLHPAINEISGKIQDRLKKAGQRAFAGQDPTAEMQRLGLDAVSAVRKKITDGPFAPLSPRTIAERKARGRTSEKPLIDTGQLRQAITYVVRKDGK